MSDWAAGPAPTPWDLPLPFTRAFTPAAGDIDGLNHTNNAVYVQWCEKTAWAHSEALGLSLADYHRLDRAMAIRHADYDYLLPTQLGETLTLATWLTASDGKLTMERRFQLVRERGGRFTAYPLYTLLFAPDAQLRTGQHCRAE